MYGEEETCIQGFCGSLRQRDQLENTGIDGRIILRWIFKKWNGETDWIDPALFLFSSFSSGPRAYAPDAPQPVGLYAYCATLVF
jgi:hypothetical protein